MDVLHAMDERKSHSSWVVAVLFALLPLLVVAALYAPHFEHPTAGASVSPSTQAALPIVELWLSTADRRLKLVQQPAIEMGALGSSTADVVIDLQKKYQTVDGFGAAMTDSSAWLLQNRLNASQRNALLHELYGPPPNLNFNMMRLTIGASDFSLKPYTLDDVQCHAQSARRDTDRARGPFR
jgi:glucosylceramidase